MSFEISRRILLFNYIYGTSFPVIAAPITSIRSITEVTTAYILTIHISMRWIPRTDISMMNLTMTNTTGNLTISSTTITTTPTTGKTNRVGIFDSNITNKVNWTPQQVFKFMQRLIIRQYCRNCSTILKK